MKNRYLLLADLALFALAALGAFIARFDLGVFERRPEFVVYALAAVVIKPIIFYFLGMYRRYWRYASIQDLGVVFMAVSAATVAMAVFVVVAHGPVFSAQFSRVVIFNDWLMTLATAGGLRVTIRLIHDANHRKRGGDVPAGSARRILIVGAGAAGTMVAREMRRNPQLGMIPVGFLDDDPGKVGKHVVGLPVFGNTGMLPDAVVDRRIDMVIIAMPSAKGAVVRAVLDQCMTAGVKSQTIPGVYELLDGVATVNRLRNIDIADLLRRSQIDNKAKVAPYAEGQVVLITGGGGSIGCELARQIADASPKHLVLLGHGENSIFEAAARIRAGFPDVRLSTVIADIRDDGRLGMVFDRIKPTIVFHAAAHKHVPLMEENPEEAVTNNIIGTRNVVRQAIRAGIERFVLISTDKAVAPTSLMGATKRLAETIVRQAARDTGLPFVAVRFGNVLGSRGSVVHTFKQQIERGGPVTVTHPDMTRFFMTIPEAVHLVLQASGEGKGGDLFMLDMGEPVKIVQLAKDLIRLSGLNESDVPIVFSGIRNGEKLHEVLFDDGCQTQRTSLPEVFQVVGPDPCMDVDLDALIPQLETAAHRGDRAAIARLLEQTIPGFVPDMRVEAPTPA